MAVKSDMTSYKLAACPFYFLLILVYLLALRLWRFWFGTRPCPGAPVPVIPCFPSLSHRPRYARPGHHDHAAAAAAAHAFAARERRESDGSAPAVPALPAYLGRASGMPCVAYADVGVG